MSKEPVVSPAVDIALGQSEFIWKGPLYKRTTVPVWYYVVLVIIALALGAGFYVANQPLSIVVVAAALLFFLTHANEVPKAHRYTVSTNGIGIEDQTFSFTDLKSFWISDSPTIVTLYIEQAGRSLFPLSIPIRHNDVDGIRALLRNNLPESKRRGDLWIDIFARITGIN